MKKDYHLIGLMSGTSLDGVDLAYCTFYKDNSSFKIEASKTFPYNESWKKRLRNADQINANELAQLEIDLSKLFSEYILQFIDTYKLKNIDAISSHGHTLFHQPKKGYTYQIGQASYISALTSYKVIADFRSADVALGGQGAPLVPIGDRNLFSNYNNRINLGGIANISFELENKTLAFDICPLNMALNEVVQELAYEYDSEGEIARSGNIDQQLLTKLNAIQFYQKKGPKSLGKEWYTDTFYPLLLNTNRSIQDTLRTLIEHMAHQICRSMKGGNTLITGGGAHNSFLIERIKALSENEIIVPEKNIIDFKEALIFAYLGYLRMNERINVLSSVTGATKDHIAGIIHIN